MSTNKQMTKKIIALAVIMFAVSSIAFAGALPKSDPKGNTFTFTPARNVIIDYISDAGTVHVNFTITGKNTAGNRVFSTSNKTTSIYYIDDESFQGQTLQETDNITQYSTLKPGETFE